MSSETSFEALVADYALAVGRYIRACERSSGMSDEPERMQLARNRLRTAERAAELRGFEAALREVLAIIEAEPDVRAHVDGGQNAQGLVAGAAALGAKLHGKYLAAQIRALTPASAAPEEPKP